MLRRSSGKIRRSTPPGNAALTLRKGVYPEVVERDGGKCQMCGRAGQEVHEICGRAKFSSRTMSACFQVKNMICLCRLCHSRAATVETRVRLLTLLHEKFGYNYGDPPWSEYYDMGTEI
jgi:hypothetical protein